MAKMSSGEPRDFDFTQLNLHHQLERESLVENAPWNNTVSVTAFPECGRQRIPWQTGAESVAKAWYSAASMHRPV